MGNDYRLFQSTPAWTLAKAVEAGDVKKIKEEVLPPLAQAAYKRFSKKFPTLAQASRLCIQRILKRMLASIIYKSNQKKCVVCYVIYK